LNKGILLDRGIECGMIGMSLGQLKDLDVEKIILTYYHIVLIKCKCLFYLLSYTVSLLHTLLTDKVVLKPAFYFEHI